MQKVTYHIPNISCHHCIHTIKTELEEQGGVVSVEGDLDSKCIVISYNPPAAPELLVDILKEINYPPDL